MSLHVMTSGHTCVSMVFLPFRDMSSPVELPGEDTLPCCDMSTPFEPMMFGHVATSCHDMGTLSRSLLDETSTMS